jgi:hypothetical protein
MTKSFITTTQFSKQNTGSLNGRLVAPPPTLVPPSPFSPEALLCNTVRQPEMSSSPVLTSAPCISQLTSGLSQQLELPTSLLFSFLLNSPLLKIVTTITEWYCGWGVFAGQQSKGLPNRRCVVPAFLLRRTSVGSGRHTVNSTTPSQVKGSRSREVRPH